MPSWYGIYTKFTKKIDLKQSPTISYLKHGLPLYARNWAVRNGNEKEICAKGDRENVGANEGNKIIYMDRGRERMSNT
jgi:hypothetical protein